AAKIYRAGFALLRRQPRLAYFRARDAAAWALWLNGVILAGSFCVMLTPIGPTSRSGFQLLAFIDGYGVASILQALLLRRAARMFAKPMKVAASDIKIAATPASARVTFVQEWESGGYHDRGPKQLVIVREEGKARIAREEMLGSARAPSGAAMAAAEKLALVV